MYKLTLTHDERAAFDWVGYRYNAGEVAALIWEEYRGELEWDAEGDIEFEIPESVAWLIKELAEEENMTWPCFAPELRDKLNSFLDKIV